MLSLNELVDIVNNDTYNKDLKYVRWREVYYGMSLHIDGVCPSFKDIRTGAMIKPHGWCHLEYDLIFDAFLLNKYPREHEETRNWRKSVYKPFTRSPFIQCIQVITGAIFQDSGYGLTVNNKADNDYIWGNNFHGKNLVQYISESFQHIAADPNGVFVVVPKKLPEGNEDVEPDIWFIHSKDIRHISDEEIVFQKEELFWAINTIGYFRFQKVEGTAQYAEMDGGNGYYAHMTDKLPVFKAGGIWNGQKYWDSWFTNAKPLADEYISAASSAQLVNKEASHPFIIEASVECPGCGGEKKYQYCSRCNCDVSSGGCQCHDPENYALRNCETCKGVGTISHNPGDRLIAPSEDMDKDLIKIVNPNTAINEFHAKNNTELFNQLFRALYLNYIEQAQSGVAKDKDMEARYQFILRISNDLFDRLIPQILTHILLLRNVAPIGGQTRPAAPEFVIVKPTQFQIKTSFDLLEEYKIATESKIPAFQRQALLEDYTDKQFGGNDVLKKKTQIINALDILATMDIAEIESALLNGAATSREYQYHIHLPNILDKLVRQRGSEWFIATAIDVIEPLVGEQFNIIKPLPMQTIPEVRLNEYQ
jgi:hypothetical protein